MANKRRGGLKSVLPSCVCFASLLEGGQALPAQCRISPNWNTSTGLGGATQLAGSGAGQNNTQTPKLLGGGVTPAEQ